MFESLIIYSKLASFIDSKRTKCWDVTQAANKIMSQWTNQNSKKAIIFLRLLIKTKQTNKKPQIYYPSYKNSKFPNSDFFFSCEQHFMDVWIYIMR